MVNSVIFAWPRTKREAKKNKKIVGNNRKLDIREGFGMFFAGWQLRVAEGGEPPCSFLVLLMSKVICSPRSYRRCPLSTNQVWSLVLNEIIILNMWLHCHLRPWVHVVARNDRGSLRRSTASHPLRVGAWRMSKLGQIACVSL